MAGLRRSNNRMISGTVAGIAEFIGMDITLARILFVLFALFWGSGLLVYLVCFLVMYLNER